MEMRVIAKSNRLQRVNIPLNFLVFVSLCYLSYPNQVCRAMIWPSAGKAHCIMVGNSLIDE